MTEKAIQRYRVVERLASGGMAEVYLAESAGLEGFKKQVAIKRVLPHLSEKKRFIAMFLDEARLSAQLNHSNVAHVFDIGVGDNAYFIVMEYVEGTDLKHLMSYFFESGRPVPLESALYIVSKICEGLAYAHELTGLDGHPLNAVHRDMSPPNVLLSKYGEVKIVDFGLAKASTQLEKSEAGIIKGKFSYLAPEAAGGIEVDARADIFAVGVILWEMLASRKLFLGKNDYDTVKLVQTADVPAIDSINPQANAPELLRILGRALARDRDERYSTAREFGRDLTQLLFRLGKAVDSFDIAELVRVAMVQRAPRAPVVGMSFIDQLIDETLLRFTSLRDQQLTQGASSTADVSTASFSSSLEIEDLDSWSDLHGRGEPSKAALLVRNTLPAGAFEEGNLAALEDHDEPRQRRVTSTPLDEEPTTRMSAEAAVALIASAKKARPAPAAAARPNATEAKASAAKDDSKGPSSIAVKAMLLLVIAAGAGAALWFSGAL